MRHYELSIRPFRQVVRDYVIDECVETIQAAVNMLAALTIEQGEIDMAIDRMDARNDMHGRF